MKKIISKFLAVSLIIGCCDLACAATDYKPYQEGDTVNTRELADEDYVFTVGSEKFTLLDTVADSDLSHYLIIANQTYGSRTIKADSFTSTATTSLNYWLNNTFSALNEKVTEQIDFSHTWNLDPAPNGKTSIAEGTTFTAGITIPSVSELEGYGGKLGYADTGTNFATRTLNNNSESANIILVYQHGTSGINSNSWAIGGKKSAQIPLRPIFYVNKDFFAEVPVDLDNTGDAVKAEIMTLGYDRLIEIYDTEDVINKIGATPPSGYIKLDDLEVKTISGEDVKYGETLVVSYKYADTNEYPQKSVSYLWERVFGEEAVEVGIGDKYVVTEADTLGGKYRIRATITVTDEADNQAKRVLLPTAIIPPIITKSYRPNVNIGVKKNTENGDYKFEYDGQKFVLIDSFNNDNSTFFVASDDDWGRASINSAYFNPSLQGNIAYIMNETLPKDGLNENTIPHKMLEHIDFNHQWACEAAPENVDSEVHDEYSFKAGITLLSFTEIEKYKEIVATINNLVGFSRTATNYVSSSKPDKSYINVIKWNDGETAIWTNHYEIPTGMNVKPVFYLDKDFFLKERLDLTKVGAEALKILNKTYKIEDFNGLYTDEELLESGFSYNYTLEVTAVSGLGGGTANVTGTVTSNIVDKTDAILIFAVYDSENIMVASSATDISLNGKGDFKPINLNAGTLDAGTYSAKVMLWDNFYDINAKILHYEQ